MKLSVDLDSRVLNLSDAPPVRGEVLIGELRFTSRGIPRRLPSGTGILIGLKSWANPADTLLASVTPSRPNADGSPYTFSLSLNTAEMLAKFIANVTEFPCSIEVKWETSAGSGAYRKSHRKKFTVEADTIRDTDASPTVSTGSNAINLGTISAGSSATGTVTVTGATAGDVVSLGYTGSLDYRLILSWAVTGADTVTVQVGNPSGSNIACNLGTVKARVFK